MWGGGGWGGRPVFRSRNLKIVIATRGLGIKENRCRGLWSGVGGRFWALHLDDPTRHFRENRVQNLKIAIATRGFRIKENRCRGLRSGVVG